MKDLKYRLIKFDVNIQTLKKNEYHKRYKLARVSHLYFYIFFSRTDKKKKKMKRFYPFKKIKGIIKRKDEKKFYRLKITRK